MKGTPVTHPLLIDFINRHYRGDAAGRYYFQNGPQKVFVDLEGAPYILSFDAAQEQLRAHTGQGVAQVDAVSLLDDGGVALLSDLGPAEFDDRELIHLERFLRVPRGRDPVEALEILATQPGTDAGVRFAFSGREVALGYCTRFELGARFGFVSDPSPDRDETEYCD